MATISECRDAAGRHGLEIRGEPTGKRGWRYSLFRRDELLGARQSAGALMNLIKSAVSAEPEACGEDELRTVRSAYQAVLGELDRANAEIGRLREALQQREDEISTLKSGESTENKHSEQRNINELLNTDSPQNRKGGIEDILAEILARLSGMEKRIGVTGAGQEKRKALNIAGWSVHRDAKGFHRAFRNIRGKVHGVYLGRDISDTVLISTKLTDKYQEITGETDADSRSDSAADRAAFKAAYDRIGEGRGFVRIHRIRESLKWTAEKFNKVLGELLAGYAVEIHQGDPTGMTETEIRDSYTDGDGNLYVTVSRRAE